MPSRRDQIKLSEAEQAELLDAERIVVVTSIGPRGWPHSMPMWFCVRDGEIWVWTFAKSQKVRNLERDPRATLLVETGTEYTELRGIQIEAEAELIRETPEVARFGSRARGPLHATASTPSTATPRRPCRPRRRSASRSGSSRSAPPPGTTASSAERTER